MVQRSHISPTIMVAYNTKLLNVVVLPVVAYLVRHNSRIINYAPTIKKRYKISYSQRLVQQKSEEMQPFPSPIGMGRNA